MISVLFLLLSSLCCAITVVSDDVFCAHEGDKHLFGSWDAELSSIKGEVCYGKGAVWMRPCVTRPGFDLYYRPENAVPISSGKHPCYTRHSDKKQWADPFKDLFNIVYTFFYSQEKLFSVYISQHYKIPPQDILCAAVTGIKESFSDKSVYSGVEHPDFGSWARHIPWYSPAIIKVLDPAVAPDGRGALWVTKEENGQTALCYCSEYGPDWMYYRYDLSQEKGWSKRWLPELRDIKRFALSDKFFFGEDSCENVPNLVAGVKLTLAGKAGCFSGEELAVWRSVSKVSSILQHSSGHCIVRNQVLNGTYQKGSAWIVILPTKYLFRARTQDDEIFQMTYARRIEQGVGVPDAQTLWVAQAVEFILDPLYVPLDNFTVPERTFGILQEDKMLCGPWAEHLSYGKGAVWLRPCAMRPGFYVYYRPENAEPLPSGDHPCYSRYFSTNKERWVEPFKVLFETLGDFFYSQHRFFSTYAAQHYELPKEDVLCAAVTGVKETFSGQYPYNGFKHPEFGSWARYKMQSKGAKRPVRGDVGSTIWVSQEKNNRSVLCYRPESGPCWMCYRYDLSQEEGWPKLWLQKLQVVKELALSCKESFALSPKTLSDVLCPEDIPTFIATLRVALVGQSARFDDCALCAWGNASELFLQAEAAHCVVRGGAHDGVYQKGSAWLMSLPLQYVFRARTEDDELLQIVQHKDDLDGEKPHAETAWVKQTAQFILGPKTEDLVAS